MLVAYSQTIRHCRISCVMLYVMCFAALLPSVLLHRPTALNYEYLLRRNLKLLHYELTSSQISFTFITKQLYIIGLFFAKPSACGKRAT